MGLNLGGLVGGVGGFFVGGPAGAAAGYALGSGLDATNAQQAVNDQNQQNFQQQMQFQSEMRGSAYQATVKDMAAAGLNPMLAYSLGPTQTPGAPASPQLSNPVTAGAGVASQNMQAASQLANLQVLKSQAELNSAQAASTRATTPTGQDQVDLMAARVRGALADANLTSAKYNQVLQDIQNARQTGELLKANTGIAQVDLQIQQFNRALVEAQNPVDVSFAKNPLGYAAKQYVSGWSPFANSASSLARAIK
ncbi:MAG: DNA pilot protein [Microvirus sp.]|nr:MAG: DNA pilot protein [Microvirus sp.]